MRKAASAVVNSNNDLIAKKQKTIKFQKLESFEAKTPIEYSEENKTPVQRVSEDLQNAKIARIGSNMSDTLEPGVSPPVQRKRFPTMEAYSDKDSI